MVRYYRLAGYETYFLTGTDEHGQKIAQKAADEGLPGPQALIDQFVPGFEGLFQRAFISHDQCIRTKCISI